MKEIISSVLQECVGINPIENVLVLTDRKMLKLGKIFYEAIRSFNLETTLMVMERRSKDGEELPRHVREAMKGSDVV